MRGEQIAFDALGDELQRAPSFFSRRDALALLREPLADPHRQLRPLDGIDFQCHARGRDGREPRRFLRRRI